MLGEIQEVQLHKSLLELIEIDLTSVTDISVTEVVADFHLHKQTQHEKHITGKHNARRNSLLVQLGS